MIKSYLDIIKRSKTGPEVSKQDWDMEHVVLPTMDLVGKYDLTWDRDVVIPDDNALIDRVFRAGLELAASSGIYCLNTGRVIRFSKDELLQGLSDAPQQLQMGEGEDACTLYARKVMDDRLPMIWAGNPRRANARGTVCPLYGKLHAGTDCGHGDLRLDHPDRRAAG